jgi:DNA-directed RNA polymerase specialized sigma24 family protein
MTATAHASPDDAEMSLVRAILAGDGDAGDTFARRFRDPLVAWLSTKCDVKDGRSREKAVDLVDQFLAECVAGDAARGKLPLLAKFGGRGSLEGWMRRSVRCRLISWWRSLEYRSELTESSLVSGEDDDHPLETRLAATSDVHAEPAVAEVLRDALLHGFRLAEREEPLGLVFLRLASLHGIQKQRLAQAWDRDPAQAGRRITKALELIRSGAQDYVRAVDPYLELEWTDYLRVFEVYPRLLHGDAEPVAGA